MLTSRSPPLQFANQKHSFSKTTVSIDASFKILKLGDTIAVPVLAGNYTGSVLVTQVTNNTPASLESQNVLYLSTTFHNHLGCYKFYSLNEISSFYIFALLY